MKIVAICGSPRLKGNTSYLVGQAFDEAAKMGADVEKIVLSQYDINPCLGHDKCATFASCLQNDDAIWIIDKVLKADGVILASPVYYYNVSAQMKAFIDRNDFLYKHGVKSGARVVGVIAVAAGDGGIADTIHTLKRYINETFSVGKDRTFVVWGLARHIGEARKNSLLVEEARNLGRRMVESLKG